MMAQQAAQQQAMAEQGEQAPQENQQELPME
jgi:hypothetical protein